MFCPTGFRAGRCVVSTSERAGGAAVVVNIIGVKVVKN